MSARGLIQELPLGRDTRKVLVAGYDGTSRVKGVDAGARALWEALCKCAPDTVEMDWLALAIANDLRSSDAWCRAVHRVASESPIALSLGGEHLLTFPLVEVLAEQHPGLRLVVLDAHHDAYDYPLLTHYSLFHYCRHELGIPTLIVGARHELDQMPPGCVVVSNEACQSDLAATLETIRSFIGDAPCYFSVDVDVLDPVEFAAVSDAIPGGISIGQLTQIAQAVFALQPVAADIVEYNPGLDPRGESLSKLAPFLVEVAQWLG
ncbi:MAG: arginase family protein [Deltaproteobacteria bacterium]